MASKKARFLETEILVEFWQVEESLWNILCDRCKIK